MWSIATRERSVEEPRSITADSMEGARWERTTLPRTKPRRSAARGLVLAIPAGLALWGLLILAL
jgi:hypothetical protein